MAGRILRLRVEEQASEYGGVAPFLLSERSQNIYKTWSSACGLDGGC